jgi:hypothetical protein
VPALVEQLLDRIDVNALVKQHLDVEAIVADMDLDVVKHLFRIRRPYAWRHLAWKSTSLK